MSVSLFSFPARLKLTFSHSPCQRIQTPKVTVNLHCKAVSLSFGWLEQEQPEVLQEEKTQRGGGRGLSRGTHTVLFPDLNHVIFGAKLIQMLPFCSWSHLVHQSHVAQDLETTFHLWLWCKGRMTKCCVGFPIETTPQWLPLLSLKGEIDEVKKIMRWKEWCQFDVSAFGKTAKGRDKEKNGSCKLFSRSVNLEIM